MLLFSLSVLNASVLASLTLLAHLQAADLPAAETNDVAVADHLSEDVVAASESADGAEDRPSPTSEERSLASLMKRSTAKFQTPAEYKGGANWADRADVAGRLDEGTARKQWNDL
mmetsp:Transcript_539/g.1330  ORF Transcript_539/g.1330 Transcript_539/m.1330 type:complete len:115 (+) Transcript_539:89-433(+)